MTLTKLNAREVLLAWANSGGFAATHSAGATNEAIVDDLLKYLNSHNAAIILLPIPTKREWQYPTDNANLGE